MLLFLTILVVLVIIISNEIWWRKRGTHGEFSRKFVHITVGSFVAFWPFFLSWPEIEILSGAFLIAVLVSKNLHIFQAIHSVQRPTWGEMFFALAVGIIALVTKDKWIYAAALLQMSLADGLAAVIGTQYGKPNKYQVLGHTKSVIGTLTFFVVSICILLVFSNSNHELLHSPDYFLVIGVTATILENLVGRGLDNLLVPLLVAIMLR